MTEELIKLLRICIKDDDNRIKGVFKNISKSTKLNELREKISEENIYNEFEFLDNGDPIDSNLEENFTLEDIINQNKIYIQRLKGQKEIGKNNFEHEDKKENIIKSKENIEEANGNSSSKNEEKINDDIPNQNEKNGQKIELEKNKDKKVEENKLIDEKENNNEESQEKNEDNIGKVNNVEQKEFIIKSKEKECKEEKIEMENFEDKKYKQIEDENIFENKIEKDNKVEKNNDNQKKNIKEENGFKTRN
jgi:hypothetical protein